MDASPLMERLVSWPLFTDMETEAEKRKRLIKAVIPCLLDLVPLVLVAGFSLPGSSLLQ